MLGKKSTDKGQKQVNTKNRLLSRLLLAAGLLCVGLAIGGMALFYNNQASASATINGVEFTEAEGYYQVDTVAKLLSLRSGNVSGNFKLTTDLTIGSSSLTSLASGVFSGTFDGDGHVITIEGFNIREESASAIKKGILFGELGANGKIQNVIINLNQNGSFIREIKSSDMDSMLSEVANTYDYSTVDKANPDYLDDDYTEYWVEDLGSGNYKWYDTEVSGKTLTKYYGRTVKADGYETVTYSSSAENAYDVFGILCGESKGTVSQVYITGCQVSINTAEVLAAPKFIKYEVSRKDLYLYRCDTAFTGEFDLSIDRTQDATIDAQETIKDKNGDDTTKVYQTDIFTAKMTVESNTFGAANTFVYSITLSNPSTPSMDSYATNVQLSPTFNGQSSWTGWKKVVDASKSYDDADRYSSEDFDGILPDPVYSAGDNTYAAQPITIEKIVRVSSKSGAPTSLGITQIKETLFEKNVNYSFTLGNGDGQSLTATNKGPVTTATLTIPAADTATSAYGNFYVVTATFNNPEGSDTNIKIKPEDNGTWFCTLPDLSGGAISGGITKSNWNDGSDLYGTGKKTLTISANGNGTMYGVYSTATEAKSAKITVVGPDTTYEATVPSMGYGYVAAAIATSNDGTTKGISATVEVEPVTTKETYSSSYTITNKLSNDGEQLIADTTNLSDWTMGAKGSNTYGTNSVTIPASTDAENPKSQSYSINYTDKTWEQYNSLTKPTITAQKIVEGTIQTKADWITTNGTTTQNSGTASAVLLAGEAAGDVTIENQTSYTGKANVTMTETVTKRYSFQVQNTTGSTKDIEFDFPKIGDKTNPKTGWSYSTNGTDYSTISSKNTFSFNNGDTYYFRYVMSGTDYSNSIAALSYSYKEGSDTYVVTATKNAATWTWDYSVNERSLTDESGLVKSNAGTEYKSYEYVLANNNGSDQKINISSKVGTTWEYSTDGTTYSTLSTGDKNILAGGAIYFRYIGLKSDTASLVYGYDYTSPHYRYTVTISSAANKDSDWNVKYEAKNLDLHKITKDTTTLASSGNSSIAYTPTHTDSETKASVTYASEFVNNSGADITITFKSKSGTAWKYLLDGTEHTVSTSSGYNTVTVASGKTLVLKNAADTDTGESLTYNYVVTDSVSVDTNKGDGSTKISKTRTITYTTTISRVANGTSFTESHTRDYKIDGQTPDNFTYDTVVVTDPNPTDTGIALTNSNTISTETKENFAITFTSTSSTAQTISIDNSSKSGNWMSSVNNGAESALGTSATLPANGTIKFTTSDNKTSASHLEFSYVVTESDNIKYEYKYVLNRTDNTNTWTHTYKKTNLDDWTTVSSPSIPSGLTETKTMLRGYSYTLENTESSLKSLAISKDGVTNSKWMTISSSNTFAALGSSVTIPAHNSGINGSITILYLVETSQHGSENFKIDFSYDIQEQNANAANFTNASNTSVKSKYHSVLTKNSSTLTWTYTKDALTGLASTNYRFAPSIDATNPVTLYQYSVKIKNTASADAILMVADSTWSGTKADDSAASGKLNGSDWKIKFGNTFSNNATEDSTSKNVTIGKSNGYVTYTKEGTDRVTAASFVFNYVGKLKKPAVENTDYSIEYLTTKQYYQSIVTIKNSNDTAKDVKIESDNWLKDGVAFTKDTSVSIAAGAAFAPGVAIFTQKTPKVMSNESGVPQTIAQGYSLKFSHVDTRYELLINLNGAKTKTEEFKKTVGTTCFKGTLDAPRMKYTLTLSLKVKPDFDETTILNGLKTIKIGGVDVTLDGTTNEPNKSFWKTADGTAITDAEGKYSIAVTKSEGTIVESDAIVLTKDIEAINENGTLKLPTGISVDLGGKYTKVTKNHTESDLTYSIPFSFAPDYVAPADPADPAAPATPSSPAAMNISSTAQATQFVVANVAPQYIGDETSYIFDYKVTFQNKTANPITLTNKDYEVSEEADKLSASPTTVTKYSMEGWYLESDAAGDKRDADIASDKKLSQNSVITIPAGETVTYLHLDQTSGNDLIEALGSYEIAVDNPVMEADNGPKIIVEDYAHVLDAGNTSVVRDEYSGETQGTDTIRRVYQLYAGLVAGENKGTISQVKDDTNLVVQNVNADIVAGVITGKGQSSKLSDIYLLGTLKKGATNNSIYIGEGGVETVSASSTAATVSSAPSANWKSYTYGETDLSISTIYDLGWLVKDVSLGTTDSDVIISKKADGVIKLDSSNPAIYSGNVIYNARTAVNQLSEDALYQDLAMASGQTELSIGDSGYLRIVSFYGTDGYYHYTAGTGALSDAQIFYPYESDMTVNPYDEAHMGSTWYSVVRKNAAMSEDVIHFEIPGTKSGVLYYEDGDTIPDGTNSILLTASGEKQIADLDFSGQATTLRVTPCMGGKLYPTIDTEQLSGSSGEALPAPDKILRDANKDSSGNANSAVELKDGDTLVVGSNLYLVKVDDSGNDILKYYDYKVLLAETEPSKEDWNGIAEYDGSYAVPESLAGKTVKLYVRVEKENYPAAYYTYETFVVSAQSEVVAKIYATTQATEEVGAIILDHDQMKLSSSVEMPAGATIEYQFSESSFTEMGQLPAQSWVTYEKDSCIDLDRNRGAYLYARICYAPGEYGELSTVTLNYGSSTSPVTVSPTTGDASNGSVAATLVDNNSTVSMKSATQGASIYYLLSNDDKGFTELTREITLPEGVVNSGDVVGNKAYIKSGTRWYSADTVSLKQYTGNITLTNTTAANSLVYLYTVAVLADYAPSGAVGYAYLVANTGKASSPEASLPTRFSPGGENQDIATVTLGEKVSFYSSTAGATFKYSMDEGATWTDVPSAGVEVTGVFGDHFVVRVKAVCEGMQDSDVVTFTYQIGDQEQAKAPTSTPVTDENNPTKVLPGTKIILSSETKGAAIYYTTDGNSPVVTLNEDGTYTPGKNTVLYDSSTGIVMPDEGTGYLTVIAIAVRSDLKNSTESRMLFAFPDSVEAPYANIPEGNVALETQIFLRNRTKDAAIFYTIAYDGKKPENPTASSILFDDANPIIITRTTTINAIAIKDGIKSNVVTFTYTPMGQLNPPVASIESGSVVSSGMVVTLSAAGSEAIIYTLDGSDPKAADNTAAVSGSTITLSGAAGDLITIKAYATSQSASDSEIATFTYQITAQLAGIYADVPTGSAVSNGTKVNLITDISGAEIYYTTDGSNPVPGGTNGSCVVISGESGSTITVKAAAVVGGQAGMTGTFMYRILEVPDMPLASPGSSTLSVATKVELSAQNNTKIYYTTDGTEPTEGSSLYGEAILVDKATDIKAIAVSEEGESSPVATFTYTTAAKAEKPESDVKTDTVLQPETKITLSTKTKDAQIYYTLDGTDPSLDMVLGNVDADYLMQYDKEVGIVVNRSVVIKAVAYKKDLQLSDMATFDYTVETIPAAEIREQQEKEREDAMLHDTDTSGLSASVKEDTFEEAEVTIWDEDSTVSVSGTRGKISSKSILYAERWDDVNATVKNRVKSQFGDAYAVLSTMGVSMKQGGVSTQPNGTIIIGLPIPEGYENAQLTIIAIGEDNHITALETERKESMIYALTDKLSTFCIVGIPREDLQKREFDILLLLESLAGIALAGGSGYYLFVKISKLVKNRKRKNKSNKK